MRLAILLTVAVWWLGVFHLAWYLIQVRRVPQPALFVQVGKVRDAPSILIIGASIEMGRGVKDPRDSFPGLIGQAFPQATIKVIAANLKGSDYMKNMVPSSGRYDAIIIGPGMTGNDVLAGPEQVAESLLELIIRCRRHSNTVVVGGYFHDAGRGKYFQGHWWFKPIPWLVGKFLRHKGVVIEGVYKEVLDETNAKLLLLVLTDDVDKETAIDGVHPNVEGQRDLAQPVIDYLREKI